MKSIFCLILYLSVTASLYCYDNVPEYGPPDPDLMFFRFGAGSDPFTLEGSLGVAFIDDWTYFNAGLSFLVSNDYEYDYFETVMIGAGITLPYEIAPFVGVEIFMGYSVRTDSAEDDFVDNDNGLFIDEEGEEKKITGFIAGIVPEFGIYFGKRTDYTFFVSKRYLFTTDPRNYNLTTLCFGFYSRF